MDRESSSRPRSTRPPSAVPVPRTAMVSAASRPITQQGLSGLRPAQTPKAGANRIYRDKRYYVSQIQAHMNTIKDEITRLDKSSKEYKIMALNKNEYRRQAEELAQELTKQQELLNEYNTVLDIHLSRTSLEQIHLETAELRRNNELKLKELENAYNLKVKYEEELRILKKELAEEDAFIQSIIDKMPISDREKYYELYNENEILVKKIQTMQEDIKKCKEMTHVHAETISKSKNKQKKLELLKNIKQLQKQKEELEESLKNSLSPDQQREMLLQQVKQDKSDIEALTKVEKSLKEEYDNQKVRLNELERELEGKDNARLKKHKELRERGEHMDEFISSFENKSREMEEKIKEIQAKIVHGLEHMTCTITDLNFEEIDNLDMESNQQTSIEGLNKKCEILASQIDRLKSFKEKYKNELQTLKDKRKAIQKDIDEYKNVDGKREELLQKMNDLESECASLQSTLESTESAVTEAERRNDELTKKLNENESYHVVKKLETQIEKLKEENDEMEETINAALSNEKINEMMENVAAIVNRKNEKLKQALKKK